MLPYYTNENSYNLQYIALAVISILKCLKFTAEVQA